MNQQKKPAARSSSSAAQPKQSRKKASGIRRHRFWRFICAAFCVCVIIGTLVGCGIAVFINRSLNSDDYVIDMNTAVLSYSSIMYATDPETGQDYELMRLYNPEANRIWVEYSDMPQYLFDCVVAVEDKRFYEHNGVDWFRTFFSGVNYVMKKVGLPGLYKGTPGASTLTQQAVRNLTNDRDYDTSRKLREIFRALKLEQTYSKHEILEAYLNTVPFGNETAGIQAAANLYFNKDVSDLTVAECASIVGITNATTTYNPYTNYENNQNRKEMILSLMLEQGYLTQTEYEEAMAQEIVFNSKNNEARYNYNQSYFEDYVIKEVVADLAALTGVTEAEAETELRTGGYSIYTTVDSRVQDILEEVYVNWEDYFPAVLNEEYPQSAFVITDPHGAIVGLVGGRGEKEGARLWSRATDTTRQPGSTIKPISSYVLAFENDIITWSTMLEDKAISITVGPGQPDWEPHNFYSGYKGYMTANEAIQRSTNMIPVQLTQLLTPQLMYNFMHDTLNMYSLTRSDIAYSPMALGSLSNGVTLLEMAGAYQMFSNGGLRTEPYAYTKVVDSNGNIVLQTNTTPTRVISYETASVMNKMLQTVTTGIYGTGVTARLSSGIPVAGKTGTTDDNVDQWFIGVTPYYIGVCWLGYDDQYQTVTDENGNVTYLKDSGGNRIPNSIRYASGLNYPPPKLWKTVMDKVHEGLAVKDFTYSSEMVQMSYCTLTGYAATDDCESTAIGYYKSTNIPSACPYHGDSYLSSNVPLYGEKTEPEYDEDD